MKSLLLSFGGLLLVVISASPAQAQYPPVPPPFNPYYCPVPPPRAPDMLGGGWYGPNYYGGFQGPNYNVYPSFAPFQGVLPIPGCPGSAMQQMQAQFKSHPFARSPRDFFMIE